MKVIELGGDVSASISAEAVNSGPMHLLPQGQEVGVSSWCVTSLFGLGF